MPRRKTSATSRVLRLQMWAPWSHSWVFPGRPSLVQGNQGDPYNMSEIPAPTEEAEPISTMPAEARVTTHGINVPDVEPFMAEAVRVVVQAIGRRLDLSTLDGITVAMDHRAAALELDCGMEGLGPGDVTSDNAVGIAKTINVVRRGQLKSHVFLDLATLMPLFREGQDTGNAYHVIAHECAHVEVTAAFERCFPGLLIEQDPGVMSQVRWDFALGCWDEYKVTQLSARCGADQADVYEVLLLDALADFPPQAEEALRAFHSHGDRLATWSAVIRAYSLVLQRASYHLGNLDGLGRSVDDLPKTRDALASHWMGPYILRFHQALRDVDAGYGKWADDSPFMALAAQLEGLLEDQGVRQEQRAHRNLWIDLSDALNRLSRPPI